LSHLPRTFADLVRSERVDDLHLVLTGPEAWDFAPLAAALADLGALRERVVFTGYVDDADLAPLYSGALAFVFPSLYEGFGLPPLEAMQCGAPVITSDTSSLPEVVGDAGVLVEPHDRAALAQAILDVYRDPARRAQLAARSLARAAQFSWDRYASETVAAYRAAA
jgi:glycosyltransferase involved in cell wall biosynthesis